LAITLLAPLSATAQTVWLNPGTASWYDARNWSQGVPDSNDAWIDNGGTAVAAGGPVSINEFSVARNAFASALFENRVQVTTYNDTIIALNAGASGTLTVLDSGTTFSCGSNLRIGSSGEGTFILRNGAHFTDISALAPDAGGSATIIVDGAGTQWTNSSYVEIGASGRATLTISGGAVVSSAGAFISLRPGGEGTVTVTGAGSSLNSYVMQIASRGDGMLSISNGGSVDIGSYVALADGFAALTARLQIDGANSRLSGGNFRLGDMGSALVTVSNGGSLIGTDGSPIILANKAGSNGTLNIGNGGGAGTVSATSMTAGDGNAIVNFDHSDDITFALPMSGALAVTQAGTGTTELAGVHTYTGATDVSAGTLLVTGSLGNTATTVEKAGVLAGDGSISGAVELMSGGTISPGNDVGTLSAGALHWNAGGSFDFQLGADEANSDYLELTSALTKSGSGTYQFHFRDGNAPPTLTTYTLITFAASHGFSASDFSFTYSGANPSLHGTFELTPTALLFHVASLPVRLQDFSVE